MNNLQRTCVILVAGFLLCILFLNSSMAQSPSKSAESIKNQIIDRSMTARESQNFDNKPKKENQKKSNGQWVLDTLSSGANAFSSSANTMLNVAKKQKLEIVEKVGKAIRKTLINSPNVKWLVDIVGGNVFEVAVTGPQVVASAVEGDIVAVGEGLLNSAGSGYSAAAGGKAGMALGTMIGGPGPGTVIGGFLGAFTGAFAYNEVVAPEVTKAGDYASDKISSGQARIDNERAALETEKKRNYDTVYPHGYIGSGWKDPVTEQIYDLRADVLSWAAEKIRKADEQKLGDKIDKEVKELTKKDKGSFAPNKTNSEKNNGKSRITVPNVKKKSLETAFNILQDAGLIIAAPEGGDPAPSKKLVGHVQMQLPAGGQPNYQDKPVVLILYSDIEIPDVVGMTAENVLKKLKKAGFSMAPEGCDPPPTKDLSLLAKEQKPAAYTPGKGYDTVTVTFYPEYQNPVAPAITTLTLSEARGVLEEMGLRLNPDSAWAKEQPKNRGQVGKIQKQQPAEGKPIEPGGEVKAWIYYTVVPKVLTMSKINAESAMKAAWFVPNSVKGEAVKDKDKWGTIYWQSLEPEDKFAETDKKVTLRFYKKPEKKKKSSAHPLVGAWKVNTIEHSRANLPMKKDRKNNRYIKIQSVDHNGNFKGFYMNSGEDRKYKLLGTLNGNKIFLHCTLPRATYVYKYNGILNTQQMTIKGKWSYQCLRCNDSSWQLNVGPFYMKKK